VQKAFRFYFLRMIDLQQTTSDNEAFRLLIRELDKELRSLYNETQSVYDQYNIIENNKNVIVAYKDGVAAGCGCFKKFDDHSAEIKRMYVNPKYRGQKIAASILIALEKWAKELDFSSAVLETGNKQHVAIHLYQKSGYIVTENYGQYKNMPESICMYKPLPG
jgi:GNAT superfamily N-acetyltransferase